MKALNIRCKVLTGDKQATAKRLSDQVGQDEDFAEELPQDKAAKVKEEQARGVFVVMTGNGENAAPAAVLMAASTVIVAINARLLRLSKTNESGDKKRCSVSHRR